MNPFVERHQIRSLAWLSMLRSLVITELCPISVNTLGPWQATSVTTMFDCSTIPLQIPCAMNYVNTLNNSPKRRVSRSNSFSEP